ncbi:hypothetical protein [Rhodopirellula sallentina]|uniref:Uncharacterized protein n=1 Tax=Rhodopirellula sallentina SM41 TaxID=1263870 RepID=M5TXV2_9BACT|nr:hypothetical protein [Rhodopirellula sallentina]EMI54052.1 hypothetical protein RSSM_04498 [Rhodopirellula sallentina SM41]
MSYPVRTGIGGLNDGESSDSESTRYRLMKMSSYNGNSMLGQSGHWQMQRGNLDVID